MNKRSTLDGRSHSIWLMCKPCLHADGNIWQLFSIMKLCICITIGTYMDDLLIISKRLVGLYKCLNLVLTFATLAIHTHTSLSWLGFILDDRKKTPATHKKWAMFDSVLDTQPSDQIILLQWFGMICPPCSYLHTSIHWSHARKNRVL